MVGIDLNRHVRIGADGRVIIELSADLVKHSKPLVIPLNAGASALFKRYVEHVRPTLLTDANRNATMPSPARKSDEGSCCRLTVMTVSLRADRSGALQ